MNGTNSKGEALSTDQCHAKVKRSIQVVPPEKEVRLTFTHTGWGLKVPMNETGKKIVVEITIRSQLP